jgi:hypothetical protein
MGNYWGTPQTVAFNASAQSAVLHATLSQLVRVVATEDCWLKMGTNPTATVGGTSHFLPAYCVDVIKVRATHMIAAIKDTTAGNLCITPLS